MKRNSKIRVMAVLSAFAVAFSAVSCGKKKDNKKETKTADQVLSNSYSSKKIESDLELDYVNRMEYVPENGKLYISGSYYDVDKEVNHNILYCTSRDLTDPVKVEIPNKQPENGRSDITLAPASDGNIWAAFSVADYGDFKEPDDDDENAGDAWMEMMENAQYSYFLKKYDFEGKELMSAEIKGINDYLETVDYGVFFQGLTETGSGDLILRVSSMQEVSVMISPDGTCKGKLELDEMDIYYSAAAADGRIAAIGYEDDDTKLRYIDPETLEADGDAVEAGELNSGAMEFLKGTGDYNIYFSSSVALYGVTKDGKIKEAVNWVDSDISGGNVRCVAPLDNGEFLIYTYTMDGYCFYVLTPRDKNELKDTKVVTVALMYADSDITDKISEFNKQNNGYRITVEDYSQYSEYDSKTETILNSPSKQLRLDILAGKEPDMIVTYDYSVISALAASDVLTDLYSLLDKSEDLSRDDIMPNILKAGEIEGSLCSISPFFDVLTLTARTEFTGKEGWTFDEMIETYDKHKDKMTLTSMDSREYAMSLFVYQCSDFVDYANGTCSFDSPEFIKLLEFCNQFPSSEEKFAEDDSDSGFFVDYDDGTLNLRNGKTLLSELYMSNPRDYAYEKQGRFGTDMTMVGYPGKSGNGGRLSLQNSFAVLESSPNKDVCWDFINMFFAKEYDSNKMWSFPSTVSAFEQCMKESMEKPYYMDENNKKVEYDDTFYVGDKEIPIKPLTQEEVDYLTDYIKNTTVISGNYSEDVRTIMEEEVEAYFAGEKTAEEAAAMIQNRAGLLISEQS